jgi:hypothetical protein
MMHIVEIGPGQKLTRVATLYAAVGGAGLVFSSDTKACLKEFSYGVGLTLDRLRTDVNYALGTACPPPNVTLQHSFALATAK